MNTIKYTTWTNTKSEIKYFSISDGKKIIKTKLQLKKANKSADFYSRKLKILVSVFANYENEIVLKRIY